MNVKNSNEYYVYIIRCEDNSLYTGITTDLQRRMKEHLERNEKCAKYTLSHHAKEMEIAWKTSDRIKASKLEYYIKTLSKIQKEKVIGDFKKLKYFLADKIDYKEYKHINLKAKKSA